MEDVGIVLHEIRAGVSALALTEWYWSGTVRSMRDMLQAQFNRPASRA